MDGTLGLGGHALEMALRIAPEGTIIGFDWDQEMLAQGRQKIESVSNVTAHAIHADYRHLAEHRARLGLQADGILLDLGLNSAQIDDPERGIAFRENGPLDMRMDRSSGEPASALLNRISANEIEQMIDRLELRLQESTDKEISTNSIGEWIMKELHALDEVAYVRFASVYRSFRDIGEFMQELQDLLKPVPKGKATRAKSLQE